MNLEIFEKYNIKAKKSLGQNFLVNDKILESIVNYTNINWKNIIEVWPGYWALTEKILEYNPLSLTLVELDKNMVEILEDRVWNWDLDVKWIDFNIENVDILKFEPCKLYSVIANIPYYITSPILMHFLYNVDNIPEKMIILMQEDVWNKILGNWKNKSSVLSLFIAKKCFVKKIIKVEKENFVPIPKVESSILFFESHDLYKDVDDEKFMEFIKKWFSEPRKKLIKNLIRAKFEKEKILNIFNDLNIKEEIRWENLNIKQWIELYNKLN